MKTDILEKFRRKLFRLNKQQTSGMNDEARRRNIIDKNTPFIVSEAYRTARTNIMFASAGSEGGKVILITSALPNEGKTTSIINLSMTFAQTGLKVLLIDADMRKPRVHRYLSIDKKNGLSDLLSGFKNEEDVIHHNIRPNLDVITSGQLPPNPAELLSLNVAKTYLDKFSNDYDYVFIDTPPVDVVTDAVSLSKYAMGVICVVRANQALVGDIKSMIESLNFAKAKILGFILNGSINAFGKKRGYRYNYSGIYKYNYHYSYGDGEEKKRGTVKKISSDKKHLSADTAEKSENTESGLPEKIAENIKTVERDLPIDYSEKSKSDNVGTYNDIHENTEIYDVFGNTAEESIGNVSQQDDI